MSKVYDWFEERLEIQAIADDITSKYDKQKRPFNPRLENLSSCFEAVSKDQPY